MTPPAPQEPRLHPRRCELCFKAKKYPANSPADKYHFWYCPETKEWLRDEIMRNKIMDVISLIGCASFDDGSRPAPSPDALDKKRILAKLEAMNKKGWLDDLDIEFIQLLDDVRDGTYDLRQHQEQQK